MAVGGGRATTRLQIGHDGGQQGGQTARAADRMTAGARRQDDGRTKQGRGGRALQRDVRRKKKKRATVGSRGRSR